MFELGLHETNFAVCIRQTYANVAAGAAPTKLANTSMGGLVLLGTRLKYGLPLTKLSESLLAGISRLTNAQAVILTRKINDVICIRHCYDRVQSNVSLVTQVSGISEHCAYKCGCGVVSVTTAVARSCKTALCVCHQII